MSEKTKNDPNKTPNYTARRWGAAGAAVLTLAAGAKAMDVVVDGVQDARANDTLNSQLASPDAMQKLKDGEIDKSKVVVIKPTQEGTAWKLAVNIKRDGVDTRDLTAEIAPQADAQGDVGVDVTDELVLKASYVDPEKVTDMLVTDADQAEEHRATQPVPKSALPVNPPSTEKPTLDLPEPIHEKPTTEYHAPSQQVPGDVLQAPTLEPKDPSPQGPGDVAHAPAHHEAQDPSQQGPGDVLQAP